MFKQDKITCIHGKIVDIHIVYEINLWDHGYDDYRALENCLFDTVRLVKNTGIDKNKYTWYSIGFDRNGTSSFPTGGFYKNVIIQTYFNSWLWFYTKIRWQNIDCRKKVFN